MCLARTTPTSIYKKRKRAKTIVISISDFGLFNILNCFVFFFPLVNSLFLFFLLSKLSC